MQDATKCRNENGLASNGHTMISKVAHENGDDASADKPPLGTVLAPPSFLAKTTCITVLVAIFAIWGKLSFVPESELAVGRTEMHSWVVVLALTVFYLLSLPVLRLFASTFLSSVVDVKELLRECMILYNGAQVLLNAWMVYRFIDALMNRSHPFISGPFDLIDTGATYAVWIHYCDKYLEFLDTYFMVLRGKTDQVSFLHVYHHTSIAWAWWAGLKLHPGGDSYFGALLNSIIHVMMYSYYLMSLLKIPCPWKKYLTQAQLLQFMSVVVYSLWGVFVMPEGAKWNNYLAYVIQCAEMISLFVLFLHFYRKAYKKKNSEAKAKDPTSPPPEQVSVASDSSDEN